MKTKFNFFAILSMLMISNIVLATTINHDISTSNLVISGTSVNDYIITGSTTNHYVIVEFGYKGTITLSNCNFNFSGGGIHSPIRITGKDNLSNTDPSRTNVNLIIDGYNVIRNNGNRRACIQVDQGAQINISAIDPCSNSSGILIVEQENDYGGAAIGSRASDTDNETTSKVTLSNGGTATTAGGNVIISSGTITARGGHGAGIGGGFYTYYDGMIVIYGGIVNATAIFDAAGIGSGCPRGTGLVNEYAPNSAVVVLPPAVVSAKGAGETADGGVGYELFPELGLAGTKVRVYIGDPDKPAINVKTVDNIPNANIYFDLSEDPDINRVVTATIDPSVLNINNVLLGKTDSRGVFSTTGSLTNPTTFFTDAMSATGSPYLPTTKTLPNGGNVEFEMLQTDFSIVSTASTMLEIGYTSAYAKKNATTFKIIYNDNQPMTDLVFDLASGTLTPFASPIFLASDSSTVVSAPTTLKKGDVYYVIVPIKDGQLPKIYTDVLRLSGNWGSSPTGYIRQVVSQIVAEIHDVTICKGDSYFFNGENLTEPGIYTDITTESTGCATGANLNEVVRLFVSPPKTLEIYDTICADEVYAWDGVKYRETGVYTNNYSTVEGCDSVVTLYLTVGEKYNVERYDTICNGEVYLWNKVKYTETGSYMQHFTTQYGCDSIVVVHLFVAPIIHEKYIEAICQGQPYYFGGSYVTEPGLYVDSTLSMYGCDSITTLTLHIHEPYLIDEYIETCHEDTFFYRGQVITKPGIYYDSLLTQHGCDSVYRLIYNKTPSYLFHSEDTMCVGATYSYRGKSYTSPGVYYDSLTTVSGCDSIYRLVLHTHPTYLIYALQTEDICADADTYEMIVQYDGTRPSHYNLRYSTKAKEQGFRDIVQAPFLNDTLYLPIPHATPYIRPDYYDVTLELINTTCPAVSTEYETQLLVRYPSWIIEQNWQDVVALKNAQYNGGYYFQSYDWHVNNVSTAQSKSYLYLPSLQVGDEVVLYATRSGEDYAIPTCPIVIEEQSIYEQAHPVPVYPTRLSRSNRNITIAAQNDEAHYYIYDSLGRSIAAGMCSASGKTVLELPNVAGYYFVMLVDAQANKQVVHVLVE